MLEPVGLDKISAEALDEYLQGLHTTEVRSIANESKDARLKRLARREVSRRG